MIKFAVFDIDGVLTPFKSSWQYLHKLLGTSYWALFHRKCHESKLIDYIDWAFVDTFLWYGIPKKWTKPRKVLREGAIELLKLLREHNVKIFLISGGIDLVGDILSKYVDEYIINEIIYKNNVVHSVKVLVKSKEEIVNEIERRYNIDWNKTLGVGDDMIDLPFLKRSYYSIAFNPENLEICKYVRYVIFSTSLKPVIQLVKNLLNTDY